MPPDNPGTLTTRTLLRASCFLLLLFCATPVLLPYTTHAVSNLGLSGYWSLNDGTGTVAGDFSGRGMQGTLNGNTAWTNGKRGKALSFDGSGDYVIKNNFSFSDGGGGVTTATISAWFRASSNQTNKYIVSIPNDSGGDNGFDIGLNGVNTIRSWLHTTGGENDGLSATVTYADNTWHHLVATYNGTTQYLYFDGVEVASDPAAGEITAGANEINIGRFGTFGGEFTGQVDEVRIHSRALSATEVAELYREGAVLNKPPNNLGLVGYWSFNEGTSTIATDFSGNGNHGVLTGSGLAWTNGKRGKGLFFSGAENEYVRAGLSSNPTQFTMAGWVKLDVTDTLGSVVMTTYPNGAVMLRLNSPPAADDGLVGIYWNGSTYRFVKANGVFLAGTGWHHVAYVADPANSRQEIFIDGVSRGTANASDAINYVGDDQVQFGAECCNPALTFQGSMDEMRMYNRALTAGEVAALARSGAVKINASAADLDDGSSLESGLVGHWTLDGRDTQPTITDVSGNGNHGFYLNRATSSAKVIGKLGQALDFSGTIDQFVLIPASSAALDVETTFTISAWVKSRAENDNRGIFARGDSGASDRWYFYLESGALVLGSHNDSNFTFAIENSPTSHVGEWVHLVGVMNSTLSGSDRIRLYRNGVELTDKTFQWTNGFDSTNVFTDFGAAFGGSGGFEFNGAVDDLRIYNRALTADEVRQLYKLGTVIIRP